VEWDQVLSVYYTSSNNDDLGSRSLYTHTHTHTHIYTHTHTVNCLWKKKKIKIVLVKKNKNMAIVKLVRTPRADMKNWIDI